MMLIKIIGIQDYQIVIIKIKSKKEALMELLQKIVDILMLINLLLKQENILKD